MVYLSCCCHRVGYRGTIIECRATWMDAIHAPAVRPRVEPLSSELSPSNDCMPPRSRTTYPALTFCATPRARSRRAGIDISGQPPNSKFFPPSRAKRPAGSAVPAGVSPQQTNGEPSSSAGPGTTNAHAIELRATFVLRSTLRSGSSPFSRSHKCGQP